MSDKDIIEIKVEMSEMHTKVESIYKALMGNGQPGMLAEFNQMKGAINFNKWFLSLVGTGGLAGLVALIRGLI